MKKKTATTNKRPAPERVGESLVHELARALNIEETVEQLRSETSFFATLNEPVKKEMYRLLKESEEHYNILINAVDRLKNFKNRHRGHFLQHPPFELGGEDENEVLENQLEVERSLVIAYEEILKMLDELSGRDKIKIKGVKIIPQKVKSAVEKILAQEKEHVATVENLKRRFKIMHPTRRG